MNPKSPVHQFFSISTRSDLKKDLFEPLVLSFVLTAVLSLGRIEGVIRYLIDIIPVISSIMLGFLGMILVASLSDNKIFNRMREDEAKLENGTRSSVYRFFFISLFFDMFCFVILLAISIFIGSLNQSFDFTSRIYCIETVIVLFLLFSSSRLFIRNMDRVYQITIHLS